jgi:hypothetical protein
MAEAAFKDPQMANVTLRLLGTILGEYDSDRWVGADGYNALTNAHLLRVLHGIGVQLEDRWNLSTVKAGHGNLYHVYRNLLNEFKVNVSETEASLWADDYWDDCYFLLALIEGKRDDPGYDAALDGDFQPAAEATLIRLAEHAKLDFPNAAQKEWSGPGFHAATIELFHIADTSDLPINRDEVIDGVAQNLKTLLEKSYGDSSTHWDSLFAWHIGQVVATWCRWSPTYPSLQLLEPLIRDYYAELIGPKRRTPGAGWNNGGALSDRLKVMYGTARALAAAYLMEKKLTVESIKDAHAYIVAEMEETPMLRGIKARANVLETLQMVMKVRMPDPELHLLLEIGARLMTTGLYDAVLSGDPVSTKTRTKMLTCVREDSRIALERSGSSALQALGVNGELLKFAKSKPDIIKEFEGKPQDVKAELETFLSATMTEVRGKSARALLRKLWTRDRWLLHYAPFFERLAELEHMESFFSKYRDHVNHQILVFLLGAYIYYNDKRLRDALLGEIDRSNKEYVVVGRPVDDREFLFRWKLAATFHDVGYIFEVSPPNADAAAKQKTVDESVAFIVDWSVSFLQQYLGRFEKDPNVVAATIKRIAAQTAGYAKNVARIADLFDLAHAPGDRKRAFNVASIFLGGHDADLLEGYYDLCRNTDTARPRFYDHGIMSAAVLLKTADVQFHHLTELRRLANDGKLKKEPNLAAVVGDPSTDDQMKPGQFWVRFAHAAGAIALHNIYPSMYDAKTTSDPRLANLPKFKISMETPLAYLLAMTDALQDWDRHSFRPPTLADKADDVPLSAYEVLLVHNGEKLRAAGLTKNGKARIASRFTDMKATLADIDNYAVPVKEIR